MHSSGVDDQGNIGPSVEAVDGTRDLDVSAALVGHLRQGSSGTNEGHQG
jgi:hypothetical protein